jgi:hypothetical protein
MPSSSTCPGLPIIPGRQRAGKVSERQPAHIANGWRSAVDQKQIVNSLILKAKKYRDFALSIGDVETLGG